MPHHGVAHDALIGKLNAEPKVGKLDLTLRIAQNVVALNVSVDAAVSVQISEQNVTKNTGGRTFDSTYCMPSNDCCMTSAMMPSGKYLCKRQV